MFNSSREGMLILILEMNRKQHNEIMNAPLRFSSYDKHGSQDNFLFFISYLFKLYFLWIENNQESYVSIRYVSRLPGSSGKTPPLGLGFIRQIIVCLTSI